MKLHEIHSKPGSKKKSIRRGRGDASGKGSFSGRGCKGQKARSGGGVRLGFEGGQTPLLRRIPKLRGFKNQCRIPTRPVNLYLLEEKYEDGETVSPQTLLEKRIIRNLKVPVKILGDGKLTKKLKFEEVEISKKTREVLGLKAEKE